MTSPALRLPGRFYRSFPLDGRGHVPVDLVLPADSVALLLVDVYGEGFDDGQRPQTPALMSSWEIWERQRTVVQSVLVPLASAWRAAGLPVVYVENRYPDLAWQGGAFAEWWRVSTGFDVRTVIHTEGRQAEYSPGIAPVEGDFVLPKPFDNAFCATPLDLLLRNLGVEHLVVAGFAAECCVLATIQGASEHGLRPVLVRDGCLADEHHDTEAGLGLTSWAVRVIESSRGPSVLADDLAQALTALDRER
ncbi:MAG: isochorismatase family cysteine hydrolase [Propionicimonas sp.]